MHELLELILESAKVRRPRECWLRGEVACLHIEALLGDEVFLNLRGQGRVPLSLRQGEVSVAPFLRVPQLVEEERDTRSSEESRTCPSESSVVSESNNYSCGATTIAS